MLAFSGDVLLECDGKSLLSKAVPSAFSNKILVIAEGAIRPLCGKISPIPR